VALQTFTAGQVLTAAQVTALQADRYNQTVSNKTDSYTLVAADVGTRVVMNKATATTITVNTSLFSAGDTLWIHNIGAGVCTITAGTATVSTSGSLALSQNQGGTLYFTSAGVAIFFPTVQASAQGLTLLNTTSIAAVSNQAFSSFFTSTYENYLIDVTITSGTTGDITLKLRSATTDSSTNYDYGLAGFGASATTRTASGSNAAATLLNRASTATAANRIGFQTIIQKPNLAQPTTFLVTASGTDATGWFGWSGAGCHFASTVYDGFNLIFGGTTTGTLSLYGYSK